MMISRTHDGSRVSLLLRLAAMAVVSGAFLLAPPAVAHAQSTCQAAPGHWYAAAVSGYSNGDNGTAITTFTPTTWSVDHSVNSTWDNAAWLTNVNNLSNSVEGGIYSGYFGYNNSWTSGLLAYWTKNDGASGGNGTSFLPTNELATFYVSNGATIHAYVGGNLYGLFRLAYAVQAPEANFSQGEVTKTTNTWMGPGSGEQFTGYWSPDGKLADFYTWGFHNDCDNSPYWISSVNSDSWKDGGY
ncbi:MAG: hypothetical protein ACREP9_10400 [Candidatus Dormibacteraceae bacterium]